ncbi:MAG: sigma-70 family RNA polymerase sigma factor [Gammaproteobacteria bacterium]|nr:sigma-70 family RNA polymerase sigma factor [Gammaproteobacteria bacterium]
MVSDDTRPHPQEIPTGLDQQDTACRQWLGAIARHDETALAAFYDATIGRVYGLVLRITRKPELAEEVVADVYMQVWREAGRYDAARGKALTWLLTLCRSRALDCLRRRDPAELHPEPGTLRSDGVSDDDPADLLLAVEAGSAVHAAMKTLDHCQRQLLSLAFFKGLSHQEIAGYTGMPLGSVKTHIRKALKTLRHVLDTESSGETKR